MTTEPDSRDTLRFLLDGEIVELTGIDPTRTVLQWLREDAGRSGTKEGCAEGDCGACTVVLADIGPDGERLRFRAVNSCIQFLPTLDGKELVTVESLGSPAAGLHPVQRAMLECHGSQCGFCTPGFVMSLFALYKTARSPSRRDVDEALAGNLCRCTGYRPIIEAAGRMYEYEHEIGETEQHWMNCSFATLGATGVAPGERKTLDILRSLRRGKPLAVERGGRRFFAPRSVDALTALLAEYPDACLLAGGTDVGLWVTKDHRDIDTVIYLGRVAGLRDVDTDDDVMRIGAAVTLADAMPPILAEYPELRELFVRFASPPIRNTGTLVGNIANGSPIGDSMPALIALGAELELTSARGRRTLPLDEFYLDYRVTALADDEFVEAVRIPKRVEGQRVAAYKVSKRLDQDISAICGGFSLRLEAGRVADVRVAWGGMAAIPTRAPRCEEALVGERWDEDSVHAAVSALTEDLRPITDMRASADYRAQVAGNLLLRFFLETTGSEALSLYDYEPARHATGANHHG